MKMLFLEKIVKGAAGAGGTDGRPTGIVSLSFDGGPGDEMRALVPDVFLGNALQNRLRALKLRTGIKVTTVLAAAKVGSAFGTLAALRDLDRFRHNRAAHGAAQKFLKPGHLHSPRNIMRRPPRPPLLWSRPGLLNPFAIGTAAILVSVLSVFSFGHFFGAI